MIVAVEHSMVVFRSKEMSNFRGEGTRRKGTAPTWCLGSYKRMSQMHVNYMNYKSWLGYSSVTRYGSGSAPLAIPDIITRKPLGFYLDN